MILKYELRLALKLWWKYGVQGSPPQNIKLEIHKEYMLNEKYARIYKPINGVYRDLRPWKLRPKI